jgi:hypothetical protein
MKLNVIKKERSEAEEIVEQLLAANNQNPMAALHDACLWILEIDAQRRKAENEIPAGFVRRKPSGG